MDTPVFGQIGFLGMLTAVSALYGFALAFYLLVKQIDKKATGWLALLILFMSLHLADMTFTNTRLVVYFLRLSGSTFFLLFLVGPLYYFHVRALLEPTYKLTWRDALHTIPALLVLWHSLPWLLLSPDIKLNIMISIKENETLDIPLLTYIQLAFNIVQNAVYLWVSARKLSDAKSMMADKSANTAVSNALAVLETLTRACTGWVILYLITFFALVFWGKYAGEIDHFWLFVNGLFIQGFGLAALTRPYMFDREIMAAQQTPPQETKLESKYEKSTLDEDERASLKERFLQLMKTEKPYLDCELRMPDIAKALRTSPHHLSQMINQDLKRSFINLMNEYRVQEVIEMMHTEAASKTTMLGLAYTAGFNNKTSFNRAFKEKTGLTPTAYFKEYGFRKAS